MVKNVKVEEDYTAQIADFEILSKKMNYILTYGSDELCSNLIKALSTQGNEIDKYYEKAKAEKKGN